MLLYIGRDALLAPACLVYNNVFYFSRYWFNITLVLYHVQRCTYRMALFASLTDGLPVALFTNSLADSLYGQDVLPTFINYFTCKL